MLYCNKCEKSFDEDLKTCPDCGGRLVECTEDCSTCSAACGQDDDHDDHDGCDDSCDTGLWPRDDEGKPVKPALLTTVMGTQVDYEMTISLLQSFGVPTIRDFPNDIQNAKILLGFSGAGMDVYVPENMLELAKELLSSEPETAEE